MPYKQKTYAPRQLKAVAGQISDHADALQSIGETHIYNFAPADVTELARLTRELRNLAEKMRRSV